MADADELDCRNINAGDVSQEFFKLEAMAKATFELLLRHEKAESDSTLVATWLNLQVISEKAHDLGNHYSDLS